MLGPPTQKIKAWKKSLHNIGSKNKQGLSPRDKGGKRLYPSILLKANSQALALGHFKGLYLYLWGSGRGEETQGIRKPMGADPGGIALEIRKVGF